MNERQKELFSSHTLKELYTIILEHERKYNYTIKDKNNSSRYGLACMLALLEQDPYYFR